MWVILKHSPCGKETKYAISSQTLKYFSWKTRTNRQTNRHQKKGKITVDRMKLFVANHIQLIIYLYGDQVSLVGVSRREPNP